MVSPQAQISLTRSELLRLECEGGLEFANGQMVPKPTSIGSSAIEVAIGCLLGNEAARTGEAAVFLASMGYQCFADDPAKTRKPDVSLVRACRMAGILTNRSCQFLLNRRWKSFRLKIWHPTLQTEWKNTSTPASR